MASLLRRLKSHDGLWAAELKGCQPFATFRSKRLLFEKSVLFSGRALNLSEYGLVLALFFYGFLGREAVIYRVSLGCHVIVFVT